MDYTHLIDEEIEYELALRHVVNLGPKTHRTKVQLLHKAIREDAARNVTRDSAEHAISPTVNMERCQIQIYELHKQVSVALRDVNIEMLAQLRSRIAHYRFRLAILKPPDGFAEAHSSLQTLVKVMECDVNSVLNRAVTRVVDGSGGGREQLGVPMGRNKATSASDSRQHTSLPPTSSPLSAGHGSGLAWPDFTGARFDGSSHYTPFQSGNLANNSNRRGATSEVQEQSHLNNIDTAEVIWPPPPITQQEAEQARNPNRHNRCRNAWEEFDGLRDDLLRHLLRRESRPAQDRSEDRRMLKAVHNWPFKFRGEKDTTSLNVFLDRVETFARSEGMNDDTLLASIKHLLQEDALDWYARAMTQHRLNSWEAFKQEIRKEFLPSGYAQILRLEACFRFQGLNESFAKYYRDISALFRFVEPPMQEEEKFFIVKKNMNADYAAIVTAARPRTLQEMVEVCISYDETRLLLSRQRRLPIPHGALLEPNFATPTVTPKPTHTSQYQPRFSRVHAVEMENLSGENGTMECPYPSYEATQSQDAEDPWQLKIDQLMEQVSEMKLQLSSRGQRPTFPPSQKTNPSEQHRRYMQPQQGQTRHGQLQSHALQQQQPHHVPFTQPAAHEPRREERSLQAQGESTADHRRLVLTCWNCDEEGHRFMDCPKPQAILFCYRCGRKGYSLRSCFSCRTDAGNGTAENRQ
ncbi:uncharacterized protein LOC131693219 [Topomyia yanbarensis]|uniref:uncharacterized protein LOC131693219 n=1 Tax=Topomyia yanbarensis TaxID=2498891 RepID=UPI00273BB83E|nr:uncharacterized protein LOC131693219 [Topomyia yanbarensis]XP_058836855.1 uncharacterized protein LOC131693219 [Topomyia yanbarensis]XP_058836856.1 uncharacterized protein LOC131693219 [Topomyia yanbarensis]XP_058836857.1 uncharacterized protein LOC131693219 [Topomyia yanbarensis]